MPIEASFPSFPFLVSITEPQNKSPLSCGEYINNFLEGWFSWSGGIRYIIKGESFFSFTEEVSRVAMIVKGILIGCSLFTGIGTIAGVYILYHRYHQRKFLYDLDLRMQRVLYQNLDPHTQSSGSQVLVSDSERLKNILSIFETEDPKIFNSQNFNWIGDDEEKEEHLSLDSPNPQTDSTSLSPLSSSSSIASSSIGSKSASESTYIPMDIEILEEVEFANNYNNKNAREIVTTELIERLKRKGLPHNKITWKFLKDCNSEKTGIRILIKAQTERLEWSEMEPVVRQELDIDVLVIVHTTNKQGYSTQFRLDGQPEGVIYYKSCKVKPIGARPKMQEKNQINNENSSHWKPQISWEDDMNDPEFEKMISIIAPKWKKRKVEE